MSDLPTAPELRVLAQDVQDLRAGVAQLSAELGDLAAAVAPPSEVEAESAANIPVGYESLIDWVDRYFLPTFRRQPSGDIRWCDAWPDHPEAITRLSALWKAWEALARDLEFGMANWLTSYLDPQLTALLSRSGPFAQCTTARHVPGRQQANCQADDAGLLQDMSSVPGSV
jgi:hypothetical protein